MSRRGMAEEWVSRINDYRASGETVVDWCERNQFTTKQFYYWMRKLNKANRQTPAAGSPKWVALSVQEPAPDPGPAILVRIGAATVEVRAGFDATVFTEVARTLKALC
ncbi:MAG TPA: helix-turn-helix domain-containing protein [Symbiobacteriaceae bacterium]|nr:helix-turn-helix domain-containing protein [Symbiobacteriaceae bacterium]